MPESARLLTFGFVCLGMALTPGPNMVYLISRSICQGRTAGLISLSGVALGFAFYMLCAALGVTALLLAVPYAYDALRFGGALYLLWLAWQAVKPGGALAVPGAPVAYRQSTQTVRNGFRHESVEPKERGALSFAAAAVHRIAIRPCVWPIADTGGRAGHLECYGQLDCRDDGWLDRGISRAAAVLACRSALANGNGARRPCGSHGH